MVGLREGVGAQGGLGDTTQGREGSWHLFPVQLAGEVIISSGEVQMSREGAGLLGR